MARPRVIRATLELVAWPGAITIERSIALHRAVAARLRTDAAILVRARARVRGWIEDGSVAPGYAHAWAQLLHSPTPEIERALTERSERMNDLRQVSPFAGALSPQERWAILKAITPTEIET